MIYNLWVLIISVLHPLHVGLAEKGYCTWFLYYSYMIVWIVAVHKDSYWVLFMVSMYIYLADLENHNEIQNNHIEQHLGQEYERTIDVHEDDES